MKFATKQEIITLIKYGAYALVCIFLFNQLTEDSKALFFLLLWSILYLFKCLAKQIENKTNYSCVIVKDIIPENQEEWDSKYPPHNHNIPSAPFGTVTSLIQKFSLPFHPYIGLAVNDSPFYSDKIEKVLWDEEKKRFTCKVSPFNIKTEQILGDVLLAWFKAGWLINPDDPVAIEAWEKSWEESRKKKEEEYAKRGF